MNAAVNYPLNCGDPTATLTRQFAKRPRASRVFDLVAQQIDRVTSSGTAGAATYKDRVLLRQTSAATVADFALRPEQALGGLSNYVFTATSDSDAVLAIESTDIGVVARHVSPGTTVVRMRTSQGETQSARLTTSASGSDTVDSFSGWAEGSLARHITDQVVNRLADKTPITPQTVTYQSVFFGNPTTVTTEHRSGNLIDMFSAWPGNTHVVGSGLTPGHQDPDGPWVRSTTHWLADVDLTCVSGWNVGSNGVIRATMVSPEHWVCCKHGWQPKTGDVLRFIGRDAGAGQPEQVSTHTVIDTENVPGRVDIRVGRISPALPEWISFAKVLPKTCVDQLPGAWYDARLACFKLNQDFQALPAGAGSPVESFSRLGWGTASGYGVNGAADNLELLQGFTNPIRFLDSGNPTFVLVNGEAVLVSVHSSAVGGPFISDDTTSVSGVTTTPIYDAINTVMTSLGGGYQLTAVDLSEFPSY